MTNKTKVLVAKEGWPFIAGFAAVGGVLFLLPGIVFKILGSVGFGLAFFSTYFFRDPRGFVPQDAGFILSPAQGRVMEVGEEFCSDLGEKRKVVKIFLSVFDVHLQRSPIVGIVKSLRYQKGKFLDARDPKASFENESHTVVLEGQAGETLAVKQVAGLIARRILCDVHTGQKLIAGQRLGLIRFGSQVDIYLPNDADICVAVGETVTLAATIIALRKSQIQSQPKPIQTGGGH